VLPNPHSIFVSFDGALVGLLGTKAQGAQNSPDVRLAKTHAVHAFDDRAHALDRPQLGAKPMFNRALQQRCAHAGQLCLVKARWSARLGHGAQGVDAAFIKQRLPRVHGLARYAHGQRHLGAAFALLQHPSGPQPLLGRLAQSLLHHVHHLQEQA
jgi:hypothetical protein